MAVTSLKFFMTLMALNLVANRSGRQAIRGKVIIDASDRGIAARLAGAKILPTLEDLKKFKRIIVGGKPNAEAKDLGFEYTIISESKKHKKKSYPVYEYELEIYEGRILCLALY